MHRGPAPGTYLLLLLAGGPAITGTKVLVVVPFMALLVLCTSRYIVPKGTRHQGASRPIVVAKELKMVKKMLAFVLKMVTLQQLFCMDLY